MPQQQQSYINQTQFSSNSNHMMSQKLISSQNLQYQLKEHIMQQQPKRNPNFHPVMAFQDEYQDDDEEEDENFEFKEPEQISTALVPISTETALAIPAKEIEIKGVHFKICAPNDAECKQSIAIIYLQNTLRFLTFSHITSLKTSDNLCFFLQSDSPSSLLSISKVLDLENR
ncbi:hypothetical protein FGO68_gene10406 [Halteria grandinella]|uniref:Uncharacterized protein n=1 Tax=Halteria grandinella TaxID=5974 RepID=A0A8J8NTV5_HALGN|nr:hypothetical protein FGO68_gene10406 [Halteria grandinella]